MSGAWFRTIMLCSVRKKKTAHFGRRSTSASSSFVAFCVKSLCIYQKQRQFSGKEAVVCSVKYNFLDCSFVIHLLLIAQFLFPTFTPPSHPIYLFQRCGSLRSHFIITSASIQLIVSLRPRIASVSVAAFL